MPIKNPRFWGYPTPLPCHCLALLLSGSNSASPDSKSGNGSLSVTRFSHPFKMKSPTRFPPFRRNRKNLATIGLRAYQASFHSPQPSPSGPGKALAFWHMQLASLPNLSPGNLVLAVRTHNSPLGTGKCVSQLLFVWG